VHVKVLNLNFELQYMTLRTLPYSTTCPTRTTKVYPGGVRVHLYNQIVYCLETVIELLPSPCSTRCLCLRPPSQLAILESNLSKLRRPFHIFYTTHTTPPSVLLGTVIPASIKHSPSNERFKLRIGQPIWRFVQRR
jgi:hypothetical protein